MPPKCQLKLLAVICGNTFPNYARQLSNCIVYHKLLIYLCEFLFSNEDEKEEIFQTTLEAQKYSKMSKKTKQRI